MNHIIQNNKKELFAVLAIWAFLMLVALLAWSIVKSNSLRLIYNIEYLQGSRFTRALALYAEAEKEAYAAFSRVDANREVGDANANPPLPANDVNVSRSLSLYERAFRLDPRDIFHNERAEHYDRAGKVAGLTDNYSNEQITYRAYAFASLGRPDEAIKFIKLAEDPLSTSTETTLLESRILLHANRLDEARSILAAFKETDLPEFIRQQADLAHRTGDFARSSKTYERYLALEPTDIDSRKALGLVLIRQDRYRDAITAMLPGLNHGAESDASYLHVLGNAHHEIGEYSEAISMFQKAIEVDPVSGDLHFSLAKAYQESGENGKAQRSLQRAVQLNPALQSKILQE